MLNNVFQSKQTKWYLMAVSPIRGTTSPRLGNTNKVPPDNCCSKRVHTGDLENESLGSYPQSHDSSSNFYWQESIC